MNSEGAFVLRPVARDDLRANAAYVGRNDAAKTIAFFAAARKTFDDLAASPFLGSPQFFSAPAHHSLRRWPVEGFSNYQIYYRPFASGDGVEIWRVLHHSRNIVPLLEESLEDLN